MRPTLNIAVRASLLVRFICSPQSSGIGRMMIARSITRLKLTELNSSV